MSGWGRAVLALAAGAICAGGWGCTSAREHAGNGSAEILTVGKPSSDYYCAMDPHVADKIRSTLLEADEDGYEDAVHDALPVLAGAKVAVLQRTGGENPKVHVRVTTGLFAGDTCWYPANVPGLLSASSR